MVGTDGEVCSSRSGNGYSNLFAFTSKGVPTIGLGECSDTLLNKFICGMTAGGGLVLARPDGFKYTIVSDAIPS